MSSFEAERKLEQLVTNDLNPQLSTIDILSSLKLISHFEGKISDGDDNPTTKIAKEELKYLGLAMKALNDNPALSTRFGHGFSGAMAVSGLLKQRQSERVYKNIIDGVLDDGGDVGLDLDTSVARINRGGSGGRAIGGQAEQV